MVEENKIVEVTVLTDDGGQVPIGIMNAKQALSLPEELDVSISNPDGESADGLTDRQSLRTLTEPWVEPMGIIFPSPISEEAVDRIDEAKALAGRVLSEIVTSAVEAGWPAEEIVNALIKSVRSLEHVEPVHRN
jgi:hypothetical protein